MLFFKYLHTPQDSCNNNVNYHYYYIIDDDSSKYNKIVIATDCECEREKNEKVFIPKRTSNNLWVETK